MEVVALILSGAAAGALIAYLLIKWQKEFEALRRRYTRRPTIDEVRTAVRYLGVEITDTDERFARAKAARVIFRWLRTESKFRADKDVQLVAAGIYAKAIVELICGQDDGVVEELIKECIRQSKKSLEMRKTYYRYTESLSSVMKENKDLLSWASIKAGKFIQLPTSETRKEMLSFYGALRVHVSSVLYPL